MLKDVGWLFFDIGSTLVDEQRVYEQRFREIAQSAHAAYDEVYDGALRYYRKNLKGDKEMAKQLGVKLPKWNAEGEILYPETVECLEALVHKYKLGIIANQEAGLTERLREQGILHYFDVIVSSAEEGMSKPDPRIFELALERAGCQPEQAVMIGDRIDNDIVPAKKAGMHTIWVKQGFGQYWQVSAPEEEAEWTVSNLNELYEEM